MASAARTPRPATTRVEVSVHERLLLAARDRFAAEGYESTTTSAIARQAGTSESQLVKHFGSKEGLLEAIFDLGWEMLDHGLRQATQKLDSPLERLQAFADVIVSALERDRKLRTLMLLEGRRIRKRGRQVVLSAGYLRFVEMLDRTLDEMRRQGLLDPGVNVQALRTAWVGATEGLLRDQLLAGMSAFPARYTRADVRAVSGRFLAAFLTPAGRRAARRRRR